MSNTYFQFKKFKITQAQNSMKVTTDACLFGAWIASQINEKTKTVLDIGTGTGLLSLMVAQENNCIIEAIEIESHAAAEAKENVAASTWKEKIHIIEADVTKLPLKHYDCIISNPPFYENDLKTPAASKNIAHHSQELKLGELINIIMRHLNEEGIFFLLLPFRRKEELLLLIEKTGLFTYEITEVYHSPSHAASRIMIRGGKENKPVVWSHHFINNEEGNYSSEFVTLLKGYYLYL